MGKPSAFNVSLASDWLGQLVSRYPRFWARLGNAESALLPELSSVSIVAPVYICALARAGSTLLLEILASCQDVATHRYGDYPFVFTPYIHRKLQILHPSSAPQERAHGDRMWVTENNPEAMEEMLWMAFFPHLHETAHSAVLDETTSQPAFEWFYRRHIQKLLLVSHAKRYVAKGNYNLTRMAYLHKLFPDARFIMAVREPLGHIASLMRQHARFCEALSHNPRGLRYMVQSGHFEFGPQRVPIHTGNQERIQEILGAWQKGQNARGWALYWDMLYGFACDQQERSSDLKKSTFLVRFEELCAAPAATIAAVLSHGGLNADSAAHTRWNNAVHMPDYYKTEFSAEELATIRAITGRTAERLGY